ncbi:MarR family transcriptional regulator [Bacillus sp. FJAT-50079]|uniref:MarR family winged helix-turn-helix transcriptional regulator n=1 Tax=Bacillus sp. FJAT-50079 TaxID=2833577 RepID=UPI001BC92BD7|nr:MarR family transcriptional regulator [Bacillus sp. FJAT-50079]MBS4209194.1 MarR family transcriptional regulator [Bacillus sp. FJAT-50079]
MTEYHRFFHLFFQTSRKLSKKINELLSPHGIYSAQWTVIYTLYMCGPLTQSELCNHLNVEAPTMTRSIRRLESADFVFRGEGKDKREKLVTLTDKAKAHYPIWKETIHSFEKQLMQEITIQEQLHSQEVLNKLMRNIEK